MYDKCYFCLDQLPKLEKESTASFFVNFGRSRGTKEPTYITVISFVVYIISNKLKECSSFNTYIMLIFQYVISVASLEACNKQRAQVCQSFF